MKQVLMGLSLLLLSSWTQAEPKLALLASSCASCHGTHGHSKSTMPKLAGLQPAYFIEKMQRFASGESDASVMQHLAPAYSETEIRLLADYFSQQ